MSTTVRHHADAEFDAGLRTFFAYRDLGAATASAGGFGAHVIRPVAGKHPEPQWHAHDLDFQMVYVTAGWVEFEYADIGRVRLERGSSVVQPPGLPHREIGHSDDLEMIEVTAPATFETRLVPPPAPASSTSPGLAAHTAQALSTATDAGVA